MLIPGIIKSYQWTDGSNVTHDMWSPGEPGSRECTQLWYHHMALDDLDCTVKQNYVCEKSSLL